MVLKMSRNNIGCHIVGRMLNRCKGINLFPHRQYYDTSRMLSGSPVDSHAALHNPVYLTISLMHTMLFIIILYITECGFICQRTNGSGTEGLSRAEDNLSIFMSLGLVLTGEIQVDIRLLVSLKSQERLKRNIKSVFMELFSAHRAQLVRISIPALPA